MLIEVLEVFAPLVVVVRAVVREARPVVIAIKLKPKDMSTLMRVASTENAWTMFPAKPWMGVRMSG